MDWDAANIDDELDPAITGQGGEAQLRAREALARLSAPDPLERPEHEKPLTRTRSNCERSELPEESPRAQLKTLTGLFGHQDTRQRAAAIIAAFSHGRTGVEWRAVMPATFAAPPDIPSKGRADNFADALHDASVAVRDLRLGESALVIFSTFTSDGHSSRVLRVEPARDGLEPRLEPHTLCASAAPIAPKPVQRPRQTLRARRRARKDVACRNRRRAAFRFITFVRVLPWRLTWERKSAAAERRQENARRSEEAIAERVKAAHQASAIPPLASLASPYLQTTIQVTAPPAA